jgi:ADP-ribosylglycohydrolase
MTTLSSRSALSPRERYEGLLYGSLLADSLALAPHWIYDQTEIAQRFGDIRELQTPPSDSYHGKKQRGDQTHYGDQTLILLESLEATGGKFQLDDFAERWRQFWQESECYRDHATKDTLARIEKGHVLTKAGSESRELGGASRIAPLLLALRNEDPGVQIEAVRAQTALTHDNAEVIDAAEFIARTVLLLVQGIGVESALRTATALPFRTLQPQTYLQKADEVRGLPTSEAVDRLGQSCPLEKALPSVFLILLKHGDDLETAFVQNVMAGGDSAARGKMLGIILGAAHGVRAIPDRWIEQLSARSQIEKFFKTVGLGPAVEAKHNLAEFNTPPRDEIASTTRLNHRG